MSRLAPLVFTEGDLDELHLYTRKTRWRKRRKGTFPNPIETEEGPNLYRSEDIHAWMANPKAWAADQGSRQA